MKGINVDVNAQRLASTQADSVRRAASGFTAARRLTLQSTYGRHLLQAREHAAKTKDHVLNNLREYLLQLEQNCQNNGIELVWAKDAESARAAVLEIVRQHASPGAVIVKGKSMLTEEIHLNAALQHEGYVPIETDLGEFVVQLDDDQPSHIVAPIIHKSKQDVAQTFAAHGICEPSEDAQTLTLAARKELRRRFKQAEIGISGVNFAIAETGRLVIVSNEGNNRLSTTAPPLHIAMMGIEKILPREADLPLFITLLTSSATGQRITTYVHMIAGPKKHDETDGPNKLYLVLVDNGRSRIASGSCAPILRCIRCGACMNTCPVYRQASGHSYRHVYSGPLGIVLAPNLDGLETMGDVVKASSLCGACEEVCPVKIPIPDMILHLRNEALKANAATRENWRAFVSLASHPAMWKFAMRWSGLSGVLPLDPIRRWKRHRAWPKREGTAFRRWWNDRS